ncbi:MAG: hypothetical protein WDO73_24815 [Ignavibacteriota bacterium]
MKNGHLEKWDYGRDGWLNERAAGFIVAPVKQNLKLEVLGWTPSTNGTVSASAIQLIPPQDRKSLRIQPQPADAVGGAADAVRSICLLPRKSSHSG